MGSATAAEVAESLDAVLGRPERLVVVSPNLSRFLPSALAQAMDQTTVQSILALQREIHHEQA